MLNPYLFIYGTLMQPGNHFADYLSNNSTYYSRGSIKGWLYDIGNYPGVIFDPAAAGNVHGDIVLLNEPERVLAVIDDYEGCGPAHPQPNEYRRELLDIQTNSNETLQCWIYLYNHPVENSMLISSGDYLLHKKSP